MKQIAFLSKLLVFTLLFGALFASCSSHDDDLEGTELSVNVYDLILGAEANSTSTFTITCNESWNITNIPSWISLSSTRGGAGNSTITVTTTSTNNESSSDRMGQFTITAKDETIIIDVTQKSALSAGCKVTPTNIVTLTNGIAFDFTFGKNVSYYYYGYIEQDRAGIMTDAEIIQFALDNFNRYVPNDDHIGVLTNLYSNTNHCIICFAYDNKGNRGDISKVVVKTNKEVANRAYVNIGNITYSADYWLWSTSKGGYTSKYYQSIWTGDNALIVSSFAPVEIAWWMKSFIDNDEDYLPILNDESWQAPRNDSNFFVAAWAMDANGTLAGMIDYKYGYIPTNYNIEKSLEKYEGESVYTSSKSLLKESLGTNISIVE